jgi:heme oxygenase
MHTGDMTQEQSERMFREQGFQDPGNARQQAARGTYDPAYLNYTLGKLMIRKLRSDWVAQQLAASGAAPADADDPRAVALWHDFHDKFLSYGGPPIPLVRQQMVGNEGPLL